MDTANYVVDTVAPTVVLSHTHGDLYVRDADTDTITAMFTDAGGLTGTPTITIGTLVTGVAMSSTADPLVWNYAWNVPAGNDGAQAISVSAVDVTGNANTAATGVTSETIDNTAPIVSAGVDAGAVAEQFTQDATASDTGGSGIATYLWSKSGPYSVTFGTGNAVDTTVSAAGEGFYTITLTVTDVAGNSASDSATFTWGAVNVPIIAYNPINTATDVAIANGTATITFGGSSNITLLDATKVTMVNNDGTETSVKGTVAVSGGDGTSNVLNIPYTGLENSHTYRINILSGAVRDSTGHINSDGVSYFTTVAAVGNGTLALTGPANIVASSTRSYATADDTYGNGWAWDFYITVPTTETKFQIKFSNWQGSSATMATANNMRIYSAQASASSTPTTAGTLTAADTYSAVMTLDGELTVAQAAAVGIADPAKLAGRQIKLTVEVKIPSTVTSGGSYSASYQLKSATP